MTTLALAPLSQAIHQATPDVSDSLLHQYEQVVVKSLLTSFGLDFLLANDRRGGHVDTLHTVRDESVGYADAHNEARFEARGEYDSTAYHSTDTYIQVGREYKAGKQAGTLRTPTPAKPSRPTPMYIATTPSRPRQYMMIRRESWQAATVSSWPTSAVTSMPPTGR